jgi:hypothetical protein
MPCGQDAPAWARLLLGTGAALLVAGHPLASEPPGVEAELALGLDSNPAQARDGTARAFARYALILQPVTQGPVRFTGDIWYRDYEAANDSYRATLAGDWYGTLEQGLGRLNLTLEANP